MKKYLYFLFAAFVAVGLSACSPDEDEPYAPDTEVPTPTPDPDPTSGKRSLCITALQIMCIPSSAICRRR